jgi:RNA polymerase sigma factor (sigma-70 family)
MTHLTTAQDALSGPRLDSVCQFCFRLLLRAAPYDRIAEAPDSRKGKLAVALEPAPESEESTLLDVYLQKRSDLIRFFALRLGERSEAEDLVQEIYLKIQSAELPADIRSPAAYLYRIGTNLLVDRKRGQKRAVRRETDWHGLNTEAVGDQFIADQPSSEEMLASKQRLAKVLSAVEDLPPRCRRVFELHKFKGLSHAEVADALGISRSAVEKHVSAALKALVRRLT